MPFGSPRWPSTLRTSTPAAPAAPATATSEKKLHLLLQSVASSLPRTSRESFLDPPFGFPLSCPTYDEFPVVFSPLHLRSLTYSSPPPPTGWTIRELCMVVYPRELASASSQDPIVSDEGEGDNVGQSRFQSSPVVSSRIQSFSVVSTVSCHFQSSPVVSSHI